MAEGEDPMNPLFEKYFLGELTDSEETTLEEMLKGSQDAAWEFGQAAEQAYLRYGLPEPKLPRGPGGGPFPGAGPWTSIGLVTTVILALGWWHYRMQVELPPALTAPAESIVTAEPATQSAVPTAPPEKLLEAPPEEEREKVSGNSLRAVVHLQGAGPVTVRVVDAQGLEVRKLYAGVLGPGRWGFKWDGRAQKGDPVEPGKYRIVVDAGGVQQSQAVVIK
jgi:hypothetical protein